MFEQLIETEPQGSEVKNRKGYFIISSVVLCSTLFGALVFSLFAVDLNLGMGELDMLELIAPVEVTEQQKLPEPEMAPKAPKQGGPSATASRKGNMSRSAYIPTAIRPTVTVGRSTAKTGSRGSGRGSSTPGSEPATPGRRSRSG